MVVLSLILPIINGCKTCCLGFFMTFTHMCVDRFAGRSCEFFSCLLFKEDFQNNEKAPRKAGAVC